MHSTVTKKGQTTIPGAVRRALHIQPGDRLQYQIEGDSVVFRIHPGISSLKGALASDKGKGMSFTQIRDAAAAQSKRQRTK